MRQLGWAVLYAVKAVVCGVAFLVGQMFGGAVLAALRLKMPALPPGTDVKEMGQAAAMASPLLGLLLGPLAAGMGVGLLARWLVLSLFIWVAYGLNNALEASIFTGMGPWYTLAVMNLLPCLLLAAALALLFRPAGEVASFGARARSFFAARGAGSWAWRLAAAVVAFPVIYFIFGAIVAPFVVPYYQQHAGGLTLPGFGTLIPVLFLRSALFLICVLPVLIAWKGGRGRLFVALGFGLWVAVGLFAMVIASWMPGAIRLPHALEIGADSFAHAAALVLLLVPKAAVNGGRSGGPDGRGT
jgi:hypothetical protein